MSIIEAKVILNMPNNSMLIMLPFLGFICISILDMTIYWVRIAIKGNRVFIHGKNIREMPI